MNEFESLHGWPVSRFGDKNENESSEKYLLGGHLHNWGWLEDKNKLLR